MKTGQPRATPREPPATDQGATHRDDGRPLDKRACPRDAPRGLLPERDHPRGAPVPRPEAPGERRGRAHEDEPPAPEFRAQARAPGRRVARPVETLPSSSGRGPLRGRVGLHGARTVSLEPSHARASSTTSSVCSSTSWSRTAATSSSSPATRSRSSGAARRATTTRVSPAARRRPSSSRPPARRPCSARSRATRGSPAAR
mmetsp:Transcript_12770/g.41921  ORF Transcript_12770/g.41921 Transcript_12770/m.41921 type:complete len:201 (-) Transcript_12770:527-1129(-)